MECKEVEEARELFYRLRETLPTDNGQRSEWELEAVSQLEAEALESP